MKLAAIAAVAGLAGSAIATPVQDLRALADGTTNIFLSEAVVTSTADTVGSSSVASFYIRDTTDAFGAINVFGSQSFIQGLGLEVGDVIAVGFGEIDSFNGFKELLIFGASVIEVASPTMTYSTENVAVTAADFQDGSATAEGLESQRVGITAFADAGDVGSLWAGFTNYTFNDGAGTFFTVRVATAEIAAELNANTGGIGAGALDLEGIFGQFDNSDPRDGGYQLLLIPSPSAAGLLGLGGLVAARRRRA